MVRSTSCFTGGNAAFAMSLIADAFEAVTSNARPSRVGFTDTAPLYILAFRWSS